MTEPVFPTKFATRGHFGFAIDKIVDISKKSKENGFLLNHLDTARLQINMLSKLNALIDIGGGTLTEDYAELKKALEELSVSVECDHCGRQVRFSVSNDAFSANFECTEAGGLKPYDILVGVPSGKLVFANDLRSLFVIPDDGPSVNGRFGQKALTKAAESQGLALVFVGNTDPDVVRSGKELSVRTGGSGKNAVARVSTSLWWYCAMDHDFFVERCTAEGLDPDDFDFSIVEVEPGVYAFSDELANHHSGKVVFSRIRKVEAEFPVLSPAKADDAASLAESQFWMYLGRRTNRGGMSRLGDIFCVLGGGLDWINGGLRSVSGRRDEAGFCTDLKVRGSRSDDRIPLLPLSEIGELYPMHWDYPGKLGVAPLNIDPYWLAAGMMFAKTAIIAPVPALGSKRHTEEQAARNSRLNHDILVASLDVLCEIAEIRGLWDGGKLEGIFAELQGAFASA